MTRFITMAVGVLVLAACGADSEGFSSTPAELASTTTIPAVVLSTTTVPPTTTTVVEADPVAVTRDIAYSGTQLLDVWAPTSVGPWPVLVVLHGYAGPFPDNARSGYDGLAEGIAAGGVVVYNVEWPLRDQFVQEAGIVACAVGFARSTAADYGGSADRVTLLGHSAGGSMGATVALAAELVDPDADCATTGASTIPDALVGVAGDYAYAISGPAAGLKVTDPAAWQIVDPYSNIGRNPDLDVYLLHGDLDEFVSVQSAIDFDQALSDAGYEVHLTVLEGVGHNSLVAPTFDAFQVTVALALEAAYG